MPSLVEIANQQKSFPLKEPQLILDALKLIYSRRINGEHSVLVPYEQRAIFLFDTFVEGLELLNGMSKLAHLSNALKRIIPEQNLYSLTLWGVEPFATIIYKIDNNSYYKLKIEYELCLMAAVIQKEKKKSNH